MIQKHEQAEIVRDSIRGYMEMMKAHSAVIEAAMRQLAYAQDPLHVEALAIFIEDESNRAKCTGECMRNAVTEAIQDQIWGTSEDLDDLEDLDD